MSRLLYDMVWNKTKPKPYNQTLVWSKQPRPPKKEGLSCVVHLGCESKVDQPHNFMIADVWF